MTTVSGRTAPAGLSFGAWENHSFQDLRNPISTKRRHMRFHWWRSEFRHQLYARRSVPHVSSQKRLMELSGFIVPQLSGVLQAHRRGFFCLPRQPSPRNQRARPGFGAVRGRGRARIPRKAGLVDGLVEVWLTGRLTGDKSGRPYRTRVSGFTDTFFNQSTNNIKKKYR